MGNLWTIFVAHKRPREPEEAPIATSNCKSQKTHYDSCRESNVEVPLIESNFAAQTSDIPLIELPSDSELSPTFPSCNLKIVETQSLSNFRRSLDFTNDQNIQSEPQISQSAVASGSRITMLSSTSLLHGNCIFNRNNTVATQAGLKTYWLCKSYRVTMCKARTITHQVSSYFRLFVFSKATFYHLREKSSRQLDSTIICLISATNLKKSLQDSHQTL